MSTVIAQSKIDHCFHTPILNLGTSSTLEHNRNNNNSNITETLLNPHITEHKPAFLFLAFLKNT